MRTIENMLQAVSKIDPQDQMLTAMAETEDNYKGLQKDQLLHGLKADGNKIGTYRSEEYAQKKHQQNPLAGFGNVDEKLTGDFYSEIHVSTTSEGFVIESTDSKAKDLENKYGDTFGLETGRRGKFAESVQPVFKRNIEKAIG